MMNTQEEQKTNKSKQLWAQIEKDYRLHDVLGEGSFGLVHKATNLKTGEEVAIKLIEGVQDSSYYCRKVLREIVILRKLSEVEENIFTTKLIDFILPEGVITSKIRDNIQISDDENMQVVSQQGVNQDGQKTSPTVNLEQLEINTSNQQVNITRLTHVFLVMEFMESDFKQLLSSVPSTEIEEDHIVTMLYNQICALNFLHSANIMHRDLKPANFLINSSCHVKICDFGLSRAALDKNNTDRALEHIQKSRYDKLIKASTTEERVARFDSLKKDMTQALVDSKDLRKNRQRDTTSTIMTRWYRAPEVIITDKNYNKAIDIWSLGCILVELVACSQPYAQNEGFDCHDRFLFKGKSCYPISPVQDDSQEIKINKNDQLFKIFKRQPDIDIKRDFSFVHDQEGELYLNKIFSSTQKFDKTLRQVFPHTSNELIELLELMLQVNPYLRPTAKQLLKFKIFDKVRVKDVELTSPHKIILKVDINSEKELYTESRGAEDQKKLLNSFLQQIVAEKIKLGGKTA